MEEDERKFLGEYHFPVTMKEVDEWSKNSWRIERGSVFLRDTVNLDLLKRGYWLIQSCFSHSTFTLYMNGYKEGITKDEEIIEVLGGFIPVEPHHRNWVAGYCPQFITSQGCTRWIISPQMRIEFSDWMCYGKQGLYVCGVSSLEKYRDRVLPGENKFTAYLSHIYPHYLPKIDKQPTINPMIITTNETNPFRPYYRMRTYEEDFHIDSDSDESSKSEE